ncbi:transposase, partial [Corallococcus exiguus]|uniref:transposase n=1 Tax=Corallococcus exiguus TaxID=83462 RepID=UPI001561266A
MKKQASQPGALFELWYADGVRFDLLPSVRSAWRRRGERLALPTPGKNVRVGVVGAVRYPTGEFRFAHQPKSVTTALFLAVLETLVKRAKRTGRRIVLVLDNGGCFTSRASTAAIEAAVPYVRVFWLPRYTSETLNWVEGFWEELKSTYFSRMLTADRDAFYDEAVLLLRRVRRRGRLPIWANTP